LREYESSCVLLPAAGGETQKAQAGEQQGIRFWLRYRIDGGRVNDYAVTHLEVVLAENV